MMFFKEAAVIAVLGVTTTLYGCDKGSEEKEPTSPEGEEQALEEEKKEEKEEKDEVKYFSAGVGYHEGDQSTNAFATVMTSLNDWLSLCSAVDATDSANDDLVANCAKLDTKIKSIQAAYDATDKYIVATINNEQQTLIPFNAKDIDFASFDWAESHTKMATQYTAVTAALGKLTVEYSAPAKDETEVKAEKEGVPTEGDEVVPEAEAGEEDEDAENADDAGDAGDAETPTLRRRLEDPVLEQ